MVSVNTAHWEVDQENTCFGVSLDCGAVFSNVDSDIQVRARTLVNTECTMQLEGQLGRSFSEYSGNRQGHVKAAGHFKSYIDPCLDTLTEGDLGFHNGLIDVGTE